MTRFRRAILLACLAAPAAAAAPIAVETWHTIGPFEAGSREGLVHPLAEPDGRLARPWDFGRTWPSGLAAGGRVAWTEAAGEKGGDGQPTGVVKLDLGGVDWDAREKELGAAGVLTTAVLVGSFTLEHDALLVVDAARCAGTIGGQPFAGDPYDAGVARSVVRGRRGENEVLLLSAGFGGSRQLTFRVEPVDPAGPPVLVVARDVQLPDMVVGLAGDGYAGVPVVNLTESWLDVTISLDGGGMTGSAVSPWKLAPRAPLKVPVPVRWEAPADGTDEVAVRVRVTTPAGEAAEEVKAVVRVPDAPRIETFLSRIDSSAQHYGLRPATGAPGATRGLIVSTHGAQVTAHGQASAYGPKADLDIVAPTNRRPFGFDWHDWGRLDFEEVLDLAQRRLQPDPARVHLTGHSMGGHGAWVLGALYADRFASVSPSAGWASYDTYVPFTMRRSTWLASPELNALLLRGLASGRVSPLLENLRGLPVQVLHGGKDDNVPPTQARMLTGLLERLGGRPTYVEAPDEGHWSDLDLNRPGADSVDPAIMDTLWGGAVRELWKRSVTFVTPDVDIDADRYWVRVLEQRTAASEVRVEADVISPELVRVSTRNVVSFGLTLAPPLCVAERLVVEADGSACPVRLASCGVTDLIFTRTSAGWRARRVTERPERPGWNEHAGGLAKALFTPFVIVLPTRGDVARCDALADVARVMANAWWVRGNGLAPMVRDTDVTSALRASHGLVLIGGPELNAEAARVAGRLLVKATSDGVRLACRRVPGDHLACAHWQPSPDAPSRRLLVLQATSADADQLLAGLHPVTAGAGLPDFVVATPRVRVAGIAGLAAAGFWTPSFAHDPASTWLARGD